MHPKLPSVKAKNVFSLVPCSELLGQSIYDVYLGNKLEKVHDQKFLNEEGLMANVGFNEFQEKTLKVFQKNDIEEEMPIKESLRKVGEYGVLKKTFSEKENQRMLLMIVNKEDTAEIKEVDYSMYLRNIKKIADAEELVLEEDLEEEARFKKEEQEEVQDLDSFLLKRLSQMYPPTEGVLWDKPHPPAKIHGESKSNRERIPRPSQKIEEEDEDDSNDSLFSD